MNTTLVIPDTHFPYANQAALREVIKLARHHKPTNIIQLGDLLDFYSFSSYTKNPNHTKPADELAAGLAQAAQFWDALQRASPRSKCWQLLGNHEARLHKLVSNKAPELIGMVPTAQDMLLESLPGGINVVASDRDYLTIDGVVYCHGWLIKNGDHARFFQNSTVHGHTHRVGIVYEQGQNGVRWEMDCGFLADKTALPLQYTQSKFSKWTTAVGLVETTRTGPQPRLIILD